MRILHLDPDDIDNPVSGGGPQRTLEINRRLARRHEITVVTPTFPGSTPEKIRDGIRYIRVGRRIGDHGSSHHITFFFALPRAVLRHDHDLLVEDFMPPFATTLNPLFTRQPVIGSAQWFSARMLAKQYKLPFHWMTAGGGMRLYPSIIALSDAARHEFQALAPKATIAVIPNGVDEALFTVPEQPGNTILYLGRVDLHRKGVELLLEAYARLPADKRPELVLAGFGFEWEAVAQQMAALGIAGSVRLTGRVDAAERHRLLTACRFVCFPSREETFGMVITEACAAARPVVYFDAPPMNEIASGAGCIAVPTFDVDGYRAAMWTLLTEPDADLMARGRACRERVREYRWDEIAAQQEAFYVEQAAVQSGRRARRISVAVRSPR